MQHLAIHVHRPPPPTSRPYHPSVPFRTLVLQCNLRLWKVLPLQNDAGKIVAFFSLMWLPQLWVDVRKNVNDDTCHGIHPTIEVSKYFRNYGSKILGKLYGVRNCEEEKALWCWFPQISYRTKKCNNRPILGKYSRYQNRHRFHIILCRFCGN